MKCPLLNPFLLNAGFPKFLTTFFAGFGASALAGRLSGFFTATLTGCLTDITEDFGI